MTSSAKAFVREHSYLIIGGGAGVPGTGSRRRYRVTLRFVFEPSIGDADGDGIKTTKTNARTTDFDGFEAKTVVRSDNDRDGIPDIYDECPNVPEDFDGFEDEDSCPEDAGDRDGDGIPAGSTRVGRSGRLMAFEDAGGAGLATMELLTSRPLLAVPRHRLLRGQGQRPVPTTTDGIRTSTINVEQAGAWRNARRGRCRSGSSSSKTTSWWADGSTETNSAVVNAARCHPRRHRGDAQATARSAHGGQDTPTTRQTSIT